MAVDYVGGKKNIYRAKMDKALWCDGKIQEYTEKAAAIRAEAAKDMELIQSIEAVQAQIAEHESAIETKKNSLKHSGSNVDTVLKEIEATRDTIKSLEAKVRSLYYGG